MYKSYVESEERVYDIVSAIINETIKDESIMNEESDRASVISTILKTEGLDMRDKICGTIGELLKLFKP